MKPATFEYHAPASVEEAVRLLADLGDEAKVLAGGQSLVPMLALRLTAFEHLVDIGRIAELRGVTEEAGTVRIGATTTEAAVGADITVASGAPLLRRATPFIGHFQIRNRGTIGGSLAHADPAAEYPAVALALDATLEVVSVRGRRTIPAGSFFDGLWSTAMDADELLVGAGFARWSGRCGFAVEEVARRHGDFALAGAAVAVELDGEDRVRRAAIGLFGLGPTPLRASAAEAEAARRPVGEVDGEELGRSAVAALESVPEDIHASAFYRRRVGAEMVARAWRSACREAGEATGD